MGGFKFLNTSGTGPTATLQWPEGTDRGAFKPGDSSGAGGFEVVGAWTETFSTLTTPPRIVTLNPGFDGNASPTACVMIGQATISD